jgi:5-methylcytosine-specific restriction endonuclease McrA
MKTRRELETENLFPPPRELLRLLNLGSVPAVRDENGRRVPATSLKGLFIQQFGICCYCAEPMTLPPANQKKGQAALSDAEITEVNTTMVTRDHILPKSQGYPGVAFNIAAACRQCNGEKGDLPMLIFLLGRRTGTLGELRAKFRTSLKNSG